MSLSKAKYGNGACGLYNIHKYFQQDNSIHLVFRVHTPCYAGGLCSPH